MTIKELLIEADAIQVGVAETDWQKVIQLAASPLVAKGYISAEYGQAVIDNTLSHGAYYVFDEGVAIPHARPECGVKRNCFSMVLLDKPIPTLSLCLARRTVMRISKRAFAPSSPYSIMMNAWRSCERQVPAKRWSRCYETTPLARL